MKLFKGIRERMDWDKDLRLMRRAVIRDSQMANAAMLSGKPYEARFPIERYRCPACDRFMGHEGPHLFAERPKA